MMNIQTPAQRPALFLAGLLLVGTLSACSATTTASAPTQVAVTEAPAATLVATAVVPPTAAPAATEAVQPATEAAQPTAAAAATLTKFNLNTATAEQILTVPNAGNRMVREFQEYRPYTSIEQFRREIGKYVDAATVAGFEQYVYVPVDPNQSDAATLQQIPGITADLANALIAARPFASSDAFLAKLAETLSADQVALAKAYLQ